MYTVIWNDYEGNQHQMEFDRLEDAEMEASYLRDMYEGVKIMKQYAYGVFFNGRLWAVHSSRSNAIKEKKFLKETFPDTKVTIRKVTAPI